MAIFRCKMCGGDLAVNEGVNVLECEYCGTSQTVPAADNEKKVNLFNRANRLRMSNEFDKAAGVYENIVAEFPEEAEAYWGLCLCKYGIEYVDDPATAKKIPTCHRTSFDSIFNDSNFELAQEYSDSVAVNIYRNEAKEIDRIQKSILEIANKEEPFDIFICYKETAEDGQRTKDSVLAQDIYDALTTKGYKVFFSRITLEDKLGQQYEPYIFSALNSAKIMLAVGTKFEYYNAVWVKNEWERFLDFMKKDKKKILIPCYADIDAYDMPKEFQNLQGQDMSKVGFIQDLVRGIEKIISLKSEIQNVQAIQPVQQVVPASSSNIENMLKRGELALEDRNWKDAERFFECALNENAEEARAYFGKLKAAWESVDFSANGFPWEINIRKLIEQHGNYIKAYRYGDDDLKRELEDYTNQRIYTVAQQIINTDNIYAIVNIIETLTYMIDYKDSKSLMEKAVERFNNITYKMCQPKDIAVINYIIKRLTGLTDCKDLKALIDRCQECIKDITYKVCQSKDMQKINNTIEILNSLTDYKDSQILVDSCRYDTAIELCKSVDISKINEAMNIFTSISEYKDSKNQIDECKRLIEIVPIYKLHKKNFHQILLLMLWTNLKV